MRNKASPYKKAERYNSPPCERRILTSGNHNTTQLPPQSQSKSLTELGNELETSLENFKRLRRSLWLP